MTGNSNGDIHCRIEGRAGCITLNRPKALNALTHDMCLEMEAALLAWVDDTAVAHVIIDAAGERAFCAGGDISRLFAAGKAGDDESARRFWRDEYRLNALIDGYPKPYIAVMHGFVMGGGVGLSAHGSHRIVTDSTRIAMPECAIGLVPDVGGSLLLARAPGRLGECLGLTGYRMRAADAIYAGFADYYVPEAALSELVAVLCEADDIETAIRTASSDDGGSVLAANAAAIDAVFSGDDVAVMIGALAEHDGLNAALPRLLTSMQTASPLAMAATAAVIAAVRLAPNIKTALEMEFRFTSRSMKDSDFLEGIRAAIIDKDHAPKWRHSSVDDVPPELVAALLAPLE